MQNIIRFIVIFLSLFIGNMLKPKYIVLDGWKTAIIATLCILIANIIITLLSSLGILLSTFIFSFFINNPTSVSTFILGIFINIIIIICGLPLSLYATTKIVDNFQINGVLTYIILTVIIGLFSINTSQNEQN